MNWRFVAQGDAAGDGAVMMLVALSFVFGPLRTVTHGRAGIARVAAGFSFYQ